jgi:Ca2+-binding RTX toxin-like protein
MAAEIAGTDKGETLNGTRDHDTIDGLSGDDELYGEAGNDHLTGRRTAAPAMIRVTRRVKTAHR